MMMAHIMRAVPAWHSSVGAPLQWRPVHGARRAAVSLSTEHGWLADLSPAWREALADELSAPYFTELQQLVEDERATAHVLPPREEQFAAFKACDFPDVRVVILGQDPYPTPGHAHGLAFSVRPDVQPLPKSLRNIYKELHDDLQLSSHASHGCLSSWSDQGVLLLNSALSVRAGEPQSHAKLGWERLTSAVVRELAARRSGLVFMLWGKAAQAKAVLVEAEDHLILSAAHPSPLSASRGFFGCRHFSRANRYLEETGATPIEWAVPEATASAASAASALAPPPASPPPSVPRSKPPSATDRFDSVEDKLAYRMREGFFRVVDLDAADQDDAAWAVRERLLRSACYAVRPGKGGRKYLRNIAARLQAVGFDEEPASGVWLRPKCDAQQQPSLLDLRTLRVLDATERNATERDSARAGRDLSSTTTRLSPAAAAAVVEAVRPKRAVALPLPPRLSPTAISTFKECPQLFLFRQLWKLPEPPSAVLTKGILVHAALEKMFELPPHERAAKLHDTLREVWRVERRKPANAALFVSVAEERQWGLECLHLLDNYLAAENPAQLSAGEPLVSEAWLSARLGRTAHAQAAAVTMVGKVDRLDALETALGSEAALSAGVAADGVTIVDYKTGKAPSQRYSAATNARIRHDNFFQLRCYALLLARGGPPKGFDSQRAAPRARQLRLLYLGDRDDGGGAKSVEEMLPSEPHAYEALLEATEAEVLNIWWQISALVAAGDPRAFEHCDRPFCSCHDIRPLVFPDASDGADAQGV